MSSGSTTGGSDGSLGLTIDRIAHRIEHRRNADDIEELQAS
jgi:hypothetical protein